MSDAEAAIDPSAADAAAATAQPAQPRQLNALEQSKRVNDEGPQPIRALITQVCSHIPGIRALLGLTNVQINYEPRNLYFNTPIPEEELDAKTGKPKAKYATNKVRTTKYTPLNFLPKNIIFQFQNVANIYFLAVAIFAGFSIFGVNNAGLAAVPIIAIVVITALRDGFEDWRRQILDLELNKSVAVVLDHIENANSPLGSVGPWRRFKKSCSRFYRRTWNRMRRRRDPLDLNAAIFNDNQSITSESVREGQAAARMYSRPEQSGLPADTASVNDNATNSSVIYNGNGNGNGTGNETVGYDNDYDNEFAPRDSSQPAFVGRFWKDVRVGDVVKVYADQGVPADMIVLSSSDPEGDCFIDTRSLDGESSLKARRAVLATKDLRRARQFADRRFCVNVEGANSNLNSFGWTFTDLSKEARPEAISQSNFLPRGSTVRNSRWIIGYVVYTGVETKIVLNAGETPTKRSRLARDLNFYVACNFIFLFVLCFISGVVEGCKFRQKHNIAYFFEDGLQTKNAALNGFVTFWAAMLVLQNLVPISLYISIEIARTCLAFFIYSDCHMYDEDTDYPCTPKSWALSDDLGQIEFIFSDKTGTLTQNSMVFRKCTVWGKAYGIAFTESMVGKLKREQADVEAVRTEMDARIADEQDRMWTRLDQIYANPYVIDRTTLVSEPIVRDMEGDSGKDQAAAIEKFALTLALCNTVVTDMRDADPEETAGQLARLTTDFSDRRRSALSLAASEAARLSENNLSYGHGNETRFDDTAGSIGNENSLQDTRNDIHFNDIYSLPMPRHSAGSARPRVSIDANGQRQSLDGGALSGTNTNGEAASDPYGRRSSSLHYPARRQSSGIAPVESRASFFSARTRPSNDLRRHQSAGVYGGAGKKSVSSARPKHSVDYKRIDGRVLLHKAESPDESALVTMARDLGFTLVEEGKHHKVVDNLGKFQRFDVLQTMLFTSHRKRMSLLVKDERDRYFLLAKGADSVMMHLLDEQSRASPVYQQTLADLDSFGEEGLRTLMIAYREVDPDFAEEWSERYAKANAQPNREELLPVLAEEMERDLVLLGGTGIEDQLQVDVPNTIELLGLAGIKLWMLTGDKVETAISIGFSCNLLNTEMELLIVKSPEELAPSLQRIGVEVNPRTLKEAGRDHRPAQGRYALIVDGSVLEALVSDKQYRLEFALLGKKCKSVLCCRVSPSQKAAVVHIMKSTFDVTTMAIGDGANDVSMIQEADVGVGIVGVEGRQAAMSSDFAIGQFRFLQRLVLVHGRYSYQRVASMVDTLFFQNFMFSLTLFWYGIFNQYDQSYLYDYTYLTLFNGLFVSLPVVLRGIFDQDLPDWALLKYPQLYGEGIKRKAWTKIKYFTTVLDGFYQSAVAFFFAYSVFFTGKFYTLNGRDIAYRQGIGVLICAVAVFACNTYVLLGQKRWDWLSMVVYVVANSFVFDWTGIYTSATSSNFFYKSAAHVYDTLCFWAYFLVALTVALLPRFAFQAALSIWRPSDVEIIREQEHYGIINHPVFKQAEACGDTTETAESVAEKRAPVPEEA